MSTVTLIDPTNVADFDLDNMDSITESVAAAETSQCLPAGDYTMKLTLAPLVHPREVNAATNEDKLKKSSYVLVVQDGKPMLAIKERILHAQVLLNNNTSEPVGRKIMLRFNLRYGKTSEKVQAGAVNDISVRQYAALVQNCYKAHNNLTEKELAAGLKSGEITSDMLEGVLGNPESEFYCAATLTHSTREGNEGQVYENNDIKPRSIVALSDELVSALTEL